MSQGSIPPYSPFSPQDLNSNTSRSPWSAASQAGSGYETLNLPPINPGDNYDPFEDPQYFDSLPRLASPNPFSSRLSASPVEERQPPPSNQQARSTHREHTPFYRVIRDSESPDPFDEFLDLTPPRSLNQQPSRSHIATSHNTTRESSIVDLTESSPALTMAPSRKRKAEASGEGRATKVSRKTTTPRRHATPRSSKATPARKQEVDDAEVVDLVELDADIKYEDFRMKQQEELIKQLQQDEANRPVKLAEFQCIVCMDNPTDLTVTHCGHLFCSECLHQAMYAGNAKKTCPVCRSPISVAGGNGKKQPRNGIFALEMKLMTSKKKGKQPMTVR